MVNINESKSMELAVKSSNEQLFYGWKQDEYRTVLHLGKMRNAVVIHHSFIGVYFKIGQASFFPFPDLILDKKYNTIEEAKNVATTYISEWLNDTNLALNLV
jgi:hypothetical protein